MIVDTRSGPQALETRYVIDATGDGALCAMMNVPMQKTTLPLQPASLIFCLGGVETDKLIVDHHNKQGVNMHHVPIQNLLRELSKTEDVPQFGGPWFCHILHDGFTLVNASRTTANMVDPVDASAAECRLRGDVHTLTGLLKKRVPAVRAGGQAAGLAAAMCASEDISVHDVDVPALQDTLRAWGAAI